MALEDVSDMLCNNDDDNDLSGTCVDMMVIVLGKYVKLLQLDTISLSMFMKDVY